MIAIATDIARRVEATLAIVCLSPIARTLTRCFNRNTNPATNAAPASTSSSLNVDASLQTPIISAKEKDTLRIKPATLAS